MTTLTIERFKPDPAAAKMPGHWLLAKLGKRVLRPGGMEMTRRLLSALAIGSNDDVVEFAPGLGVTAQLTLACGPRSYTAVERDPDAAREVAKRLHGAQQTCVVGSAEATGLPSGSASVVYAEAMLSMQPASTKARIVAEAARLLVPGGRYGVHELCLADDASPAIEEEIARELSSEIHVGVRPLRRSDWLMLFEGAGFTLTHEYHAPMHLLEPRRLIADEGIWRAIRFAWNVARTPVARRRVLAMRRAFRNHRHALSAIVLVAEKN